MKDTDFQVTHLDKYICKSETDIVIEKEAVMCVMNSFAHDFVIETVSRETDFVTDIDNSDTFPMTVML